MVVVLLGAAVLLISNATQLAIYARRNPELRLSVPAAPFVDMLNSPVWTDRSATVANPTAPECVRVAEGGGLMAYAWMPIMTLAVFIAVQWWAANGALGDAAAWIGASAAGYAVGLAAGAALAGYETGIGALAAEQADVGGLQPRVRRLDRPNEAFRLDETEGPFGPGHLRRRRRARPAAEWSRGRCAGAG